MEPLKEYKISPKWGEVGKNRPGRDAKPIAFTLEKAMEKVKHVSVEPPPLPPDWSEEERRIRLKRIFDHFAQQMGRDGYQYTEEVKPVLNQMTNYFMGIDCGLDLKKGILLIGEPGRGKSLIMEIWAKALRAIAQPPHRYPEERAAFVFQRVAALVSDLQSEQKEAAYQVSKLWTRKVANPKVSGVKFHACLDDIYKEEAEKLYKYGQNPMPEIYNARDKLLIRQGVITHATSNYFPDEKQMENYSEAMIDRFYQMFNFVTLTGESFRRK